MSQQTSASRRSYTFKEGLAMMAAKEVGVDPYLAVEAGEDARAVLAALRKAKVAQGAEKARLIKDAQAALRKLSPVRHGKLINALHAKLLALQGRGGDTTVAHLAPGEVVVPRSMQTPALMQQIAALAAARGLDPAQLSVGHRANKVNPRTGQREFAIGGWRKTDWRGGLDEAREPQIEEIIVHGNRIDPFGSWTRQIDIQPGFSGLQPPEINFDPIDATGSNLADAEDEQLNIYPSDWIASYLRTLDLKTLREWKKRIDQFMNAVAALGILAAIPQINASIRTMLTRILATPGLFAAVVGGHVVIGVAAAGATGVYLAREFYDALELVISEKGG